MKCCAKASFFSPSGKIWWNSSSVMTSPLGVGACRSVVDVKAEVELDTAGGFVDENDPDHVMCVLVHPSCVRRGVSGRGGKHPGRDSSPSHVPGTVGDHRHGRRHQDERSRHLHEEP